MSLLKKPPTASAPLNPWPAAVVVIVVVIAATVLVLAGHPVAAALGVVGGAGLAGIDIARRLVPAAGNLR